MWLAVTLFVRGLGLGLSMMPVTAAAYYDLSHAEIPKASTVMNIVRLIGGSVATALFAVVLERQIVANLGAAATKAGGSAGIIGATGRLPAAVADPVAAAFAHTFWWSVGAILIAFVPTLFLPSHAERCGCAVGHGPAGRGRRGSAHRGRASAPRGRGDPGLSALSGPDQRSDRVTDPGRLAAILAGAGFVAAEDEASELVDGSRW